MVERALRVGLEENQRQRVGGRLAVLVYLGLGPSEGRVLLIMHQGRPEGKGKRASRV